MKYQRVAYPGVPGSFSEEALIQYFDSGVEMIAVRTFYQVLELVKNNQVDAGILPVENSSTGGIFEVLDALQTHQCYIIGETFVQVKHNLLACADADLATIKTVYSHPQGFQQSTDYLNAHPQWNLVPYYNTAISAKYVAENNNVNNAAIASKRAATIYGLKVLADSIQDANNNYTRFIAISPQLSVCPKDDKVSLIYALPHSAGSLYQSLGVFAEHGINLLNLQSRPIKARPWEAYFYLDIAANLGNENLKMALNKIQAASVFFKIIGCYQASPNSGALNSQTNKLPY